MRRPELYITGITGLPEISADASLGQLIAQGIRQAQIELQEKDVLVVAQKIVSKAEGRTIRLDSVTPSALACRWAEACQKDPRVMEVILSQTQRIVRMDRGILIAETEHSFVCANAGVDSSNSPPGEVLLLPRDPDASAARIRKELSEEFGVTLAVIISDSFGRPWRQGQVDVAIGVAGLDPLLDYRGFRDRFGRQMEATVIAVADELAGAAELVMGKTSEVPVALIRGVYFQSLNESARALVRPAEEDLFR